MNEEKNLNEEETYALDDDRRVKTLSPGAMVVKRFLRNRLAVLGMVMLVVMFVFSFIGGLISPYTQDQQFYKYEDQNKVYAGVVQNNDFRYTVKDGEKFDSILQAQFLLAYNQSAENFTYKDVTYDLERVSDDYLKVSVGGNVIAIAYKDIINMEADPLSFDAQMAALDAYVAGAEGFSADGKDYTLSEDGDVEADGKVVAYISRFVVSAAASDIEVSRDFKEAIGEAIDADKKTFTYTDENGEEVEYAIEWEATKGMWNIIKAKSTYVYDTYSSPSKEHLLGTDTNGMDMLTRLMYGGRVSLIIGFIVVFIEVILGIILGGVSGYFGGWVDNLIMRIVDIFYCIPSLPLIIILGSAMDGMRVEPQKRMLYLMLILGFLGWPGVARMVRGQILSLREQEFMTAAEATGLSIGKRIFKHLIPNVIPQLIVISTMSLGSTIITEATLSFLGLGVKFPFASWGNIISDVNNAFVMTHYWFVWIPAGICLLVAVLGFNFVGDGLRDAFDPRMNR